MKRLLSVTLAGAVAALVGLAGAAEAQFYKGKRITILINYSAGGPTDIEGRLVAKHLSKHIPGNPGIIVKNVPGAGGITGSNYMGQVAKPDGLSLAIFTPPLISQVLQDPGLRVDFSKFVWLAGIGHPQVCYIRKDAGVSKVDDILKIKGFKAAGMRVTSSHDLRFRMALDLLGADYKYVTGYKGLAKVVAGVMQNETQFSCGSVPGFRKNVEPNLIQPGHAIALWYYSAVGPDGKEVRNPHLKGIPTYLDVYQELKGKKPSGVQYDAFQLINNLSVSMLRGSFVPAGTPDEAVKALRAAWAAVARDKDFAADYTKVIKAPPNIILAEAAQAHVDAAGKVSPEIVAFFKDLIGRK
ncbi:MAG: hypothetical protein OXI22_07725 [Defluviicoccus sp.]|nr:hypothetical protein [Defluviicoccus sp.]MDE0383753.1 hypothetical protein [Defluviicoccus sp.]